MFKKIFEFIVAWNGTNDTGSDARQKIKRNFDKVNDALEEIEDEINLKVTGDSSSLDNEIPIFSGLTGKLIKKSGKLINQIPWMENGKILSDYLKFYYYKLTISAFTDLNRTDLTDGPYNITGSNDGILLVACKKAGENIISILQIWQSSANYKHRRIVITDPQTYPEWTEISGGGTGGASAIDTISVNGETLVIDEEKNVDISVPEKLSDIFTGAVELVSITTEPQNPADGDKWYDAVQKSIITYIVQTPEPVYDMSNPELGCIYIFGNLAYKWNGLNLVKFGSNDGKTVEFQVSGGYIQWRLLGDENWINLISVAALTGAAGKSVEMNNNGNYLQWRLAGDTNWINLVALSALKGADGRGISNTSYNAGTGVLTITDTDATSYQTGDLRGATGKSAYQSYVDTTTDNPVLTQQQWSNVYSTKENSANKQNSLAPDGTGVKFPTVDAILKVNVLTASAIAETYALQLNVPTNILNTLPSGVNSTLTIPAPTAGNLNESVLHFATGVVLPTLVYSGFTPVWLNGTAISMKINKTYTLVFEQVRTATNTWIVKTSWGEY
jgi:hypothetical protein